MASAVAEVAACAAGLGLVAGGFAYASLWPGSQIFGRVLVAGADPDEVALTFDDGPNDGVTQELLEVLARHGVRATFFVIGSYVQQQPGLVRELITAGHVVGNHTMHHPKLSVEPAGWVRRELADCNAAIEDVTGEAVRLFRPPFGARRPVVLRAARELGLTPVTWNVSGDDWKPIGAEGILRRLEAGIARNRWRGRGSNLLLHDGGHRAMGTARLDTVRAVDRLLAANGNAEGRGGVSQFVTVDAWVGSASSVAG